MKRTMKYLAGALAGGLLSVSTAHAVLIEQWTYEQESGFSEWSGTGITSSGNSGVRLGLPTALTWGANNESSFEVTSPVNGIAVTNGGPNSGTPLTHFNFPIQLGISLDTAILSSVLTLTPLVPPGGPAVLAPQLDFDILFIETPNDPGSGICADGTDRNDGSNPGGCRDIFVLNNPEEFQSIEFVYGDHLYTVTVSGEGLEALPDGACAAAGAASGCIGFRTFENAENIFTPTFTITAQFIPEPDVLALLGIALGSMGFIRRRRS